MSQVNEPRAYVVHADVDYFTGTAKPGAMAGSVIEFGAMVREQLEYQRGHTSEPKSTLGYDGIVCGQLFVGERADGVIIRASGTTAGYVARGLQEHGITIKPTRIDTAVTFSWGEDREGYARETAHAVHTSNSGKKEGRPCSVALYCGFGRGDTCTIGARSSARHTRIYDKTREQQMNVEGWLWRVETEWKPPLVGAVWEQWREASDKDTWVRELEERELAYQGVLVPWGNENIGERLNVEADRSTVERKLGWLKNQVSHTVRWLERQGYAQEARMALYPALHE
jgi:DNA relaxase NicK